MTHLFKNLKTTITKENSLFSRRSFGAVDLLHCCKSQHKKTYFNISNVIFYFFREEFLQLEEEVKEQNLDLVLVGGKP